MSKESKLVVGLTCGGFGLLPWLYFFGWIIASGPGAGCMMILPLGPFEHPLTLLWRIWPPSHSNPIALYAIYIVFGLTILSALAGLPFGLALYGVRRLFKWLNDERWFNMP